MADYPTAGYRRGARERAAAGLSNDRSGTPLLDRAMDERNARAFRQALNERVRQDARERAERQQAIRRADDLWKKARDTSLRNVARTTARNLVRGLRGGHPLNWLLRAALTAQNTARDEKSIPVIPGFTRAGVCDYPDDPTIGAEPGWSTDGCIANQVFHPPGPQPDCVLPYGLWGQRVVFPERYNLLAWWMPNANCSTIDPAFKHAGFKYVTVSGPVVTPTVSDQPASASQGDSPSGEAKAQLGLETHKPGDPARDYVVPYSVIPYLVSVGEGAPSERTERGYNAEPIGSAKTETAASMLPVWPQVRPTKAQRERKAVVGRLILQILGEVTEGLDAIKAFYPCLPKAIRAAEERAHYGNRKNQGQYEEGFKHWSPADKARVLWENWDKVELRCALFNTIWDRYEDMVYAAISKGSKNPFASKTRTVAGGRALQFSQQGDTELPFGALPTSELKKWLAEQLGARQNGKAS